MQQSDDQLLRIRKILNLFVNEIFNPRLYQRFTERESESLSVVTLQARILEWVAIPFSRVPF